MEHYRKNILTSILNNVVAVYLRYFFITYCDDLYPTTPWDDDDPQSLEMFMENETNEEKARRVLFQTDHCEWDLTTLFYVLLDSDSVGQHLPSSVKDAIQTVRDTRDSLGFTTPHTMPDKFDYTKRYDDIKKMFVILGYYNAVEKMSVIHDTEIQQWWKQEQSMRNTDRQVKRIITLYVIALVVIGAVFLVTLHLQNVDVKATKPNTEPSLTEDVKYKQRYNNTNINNHPNLTKFVDGNDRMHRKEKGKEGKSNDLDRVTPKNTLRKYKQRYNNIQKLFVTLSDAVEQPKDTEVIDVIHFEKLICQANVKSEHIQDNAINNHPNLTKFVDGNDRMHRKEKGKEGKSNDLDRVTPKFTLSNDAAKKLFTLLSVHDTVARTKHSENQERKNQSHVNSTTSAEYALNIHYSSIKFSDEIGRKRQRERSDDMEHKYTQSYNNVKKLFTLLGVPEILVQNQQRKNQPLVESGKSEENTLNKHPSHTEFADGNDGIYQKERPEDLDRMIPKYTQRYKNIKTLFTVLGVPDVLAQTKENEVQQSKNRPHVESGRSEANTLNRIP